MPDNNNPTKAQILRRMHKLAMAQANKLDVDEPLLVDPSAPKLTVVPKKRDKSAKQETALGGGADPSL